MRILITGGAGFIGSNLARYVNEHSPDAEVRIIDDLSTGYRLNLDSVAATFFEGSILDSALLERAANGVDSIVHLAAIPSVPRSIAAPRPSHEANATGTLNVLEVARKVGVDHVVVASSSSVYGSNPKLPKNELDWTRPMSPYAVSKQATEGYALSYGFAYGLKTLAFRFFNVFGPGQASNHAYAAVIPKFIDAALAGQPLPVQGDGRQSRDFTFVETVCAVLLEAVQSKTHSPNPVNLAFGTNTSLLEVISLLETILSRELPVQHGPARVGDVRASQADGIKIRELFPTVRPTELHEALSRTVGWYEQRSGE